MHVSMPRVPHQGRAAGIGGVDAVAVVAAGPVRACAAAASWRALRETPGVGVVAGRKLDGRHARQGILVRLLRAGCCASTLPARVLLLLERRHAGERSGLLNATQA